MNKGYVQIIKEYVQIQHDNSMNKGYVQIHKDMYKSNKTAKKEIRIVLFSKSVTKAKFNPGLVILRSQVRIKILVKISKM